MSSLLTYLKKPYYADHNRRPSFVAFVGLFGIYLGMVLPTVPIALIVCRLSGITQKSVNLDFAQKLVVIVLMAPVYEEIFFRLLLKVKKINAVIFIFVISGLILYASSKSKTDYVVVFSIVLAMFLCVLFFLKKDRIRKFVEKHFAYIFYASALLFGLLHATNFSGDPWKLIAFSFILGGPQIVLGIILGYIRMNYGLFYSMLFHTIVNSMALLSH
jgi:hypothetical protein